MMWFVVTLFSFSQLFACGDFLLTSSDKTVVNGRSMEFAEDLKTQIAIFPRGEKWETTAPNNQKGISWTNKYGFIGMIVFDENVTSDGLNEKGLSFGALWLPESEYVKDPVPQKALNLIDFGAWMLGNFATIDEVKEGLKNVDVWAEYNDLIKQIPPLHFTVHDEKGQSLVIEFIKGKMNLHDNSIEVLTNAPPYDWHLNNLRNYIQLKPEDAKPVQAGDLTFYQTGHGSGLKGLPGDWTPPSRFVRLFTLKQYSATPKDEKGAVNLAFHILNSLDIPVGMIQVGSAASDYTQWVVVKDISHKKLYIRPYTSWDVKIIDLNKQNFEPGTPVIKTKI